MFNWFKKAPAAPRITDKKEIDRRYGRYRWEQAASMTLGYAIFYVCRLSFSATKKSLIDGGWYTAQEIGWVGSAMLFAYAFGKISHGFLADRANIRRYMGFGLFVSALMNFIVGWYVPAMLLVVVWFINGFAQACGATCSIVGISRWYRKRERGTFYGIFSMSNNFGEAFAYILTSIVMVYAAKWFDIEPVQNLFNYLDTWFVSTPPTLDGHYGNGAAWRSGFWGAAFLGVVGVMILSKFFYDSPESEGLPSVPEWADEPPDKVEKAAAGDVKKGQMLALKNWAIWMIAIGGGLFAMTRYAIIDWGMFFLQVKKGYAGTTAATVISINSIVGGFSSAACGYITDKFFNGKRDGFVFIAGLMNITALSIFMFGPADCLWLDVFAMVLFGLAVGILLTFLGGLMAVDLAPRIATGAALGIAGMGSYIGAGISSLFSGYLIKPIAKVAEMADLSNIAALTSGKVYMLQNGTYIKVVDKAVEALMDGSVAMKIQTTVDATKIAVPYTAEKLADKAGWLLSDGTTIAQKAIEEGAKVLSDGSLLLKSGKLIDAGGNVINRFYDSTFNIFGHTVTVDWIAVFWIGAAILSMLCALSVWNARPKEDLPQEQASAS